MNLKKLIALGTILASSLNWAGAINQDSKKINCTMIRQGEIYNYESELKIDLKNNNTLRLIPQDDGSLSVVKGRIHRINPSPSNNTWVILTKEKIRDKYDYANMLIMDLASGKTYRNTMSGLPPYEYGDLSLTSSKGELYDCSSQ